MKKLFFSFITVLILGTGLLTSCSNTTNPPLSDDWVQFKPAELSDYDFIGNWTFSNKLIIRKGIINGETQTPEEDIPDEKYFFESSEKVWTGKNLSLKENKEEFLSNFTFTKSSFLKKTSSQPVPFTVTEDMITIQNLINKDKTKIKSIITVKYSNPSEKTEIDCDTVYTLTNTDFWAETTISEKDDWLFKKWYVYNNGNKSIKISGETKQIPKPSLLNAEDKNNILRKTAENPDGEKIELNDFLSCFYTKEKIYNQFKNFGSEFANLKENDIQGKVAVSKDKKLIKTLNEFNYKHEASDTELSGSENCIYSISEFGWKQN